MNMSSAFDSTKSLVKVNSFIKSVYNWMAVGLLLTAFTSLYVSQSETMLRIIFGNQLVFFGLIIGELALVFFLSARVQKIKASTATVFLCFILF